MKSLLSIALNLSEYREYPKIFNLSKRVESLLSILPGHLFTKRTPAYLLAFGLIVLPEIASCEHTRRDVMEVIFQDGTHKIYNLHDLDEMERVEFTSASPWTEGQNLYSGVPLLSFMQSLGSDVSRIEITARNNYVVEFSLDDVTPDWPILATHIDGVPIPNRTKGPFWVVYPYDDVPDLRREDIYARSIWQIEMVKAE